MNDREQLLQWQIQGGGPGEPRPHLFINQKKIGGGGLPLLYVRVG